MLERLLNRRRFLLLAFTLSLFMYGGSLWAGNGNGGGKPPKDDPPAVELPTYSFTLLGTLGGTRGSRPGGMNSNGQIVGSADALIPVGPVVLPSGNTISEVTHAFLNVVDGSGGREMIDLHNQFVDEKLIPPFDWDKIEGLIVANALDINETGQIVAKINEIIAGEFAGSYSARYSPALFDENGVQVAPSALDTIPNLGGPRINNNGVVAGTKTDISPDTAAIWDDVNGTDVIGDVFDVENYSYEINDSRQVLGRTSNLNTRAWRYSPSAGVVYIPLLSKRSQSCTPHAMNELGEVVCTDSDGKRNYHRAVLFSDATGPVDLGTLGGDGSHGGAINNFGHVVGEAQLSDGSWRLFLYTPETGMFNLEAQITNLPLEEQGMLYSWNVLFLDDAGRICGYSRQSKEVYLLTPQ